MSRWVLITAGLALVALTWVAAAEHPGPFPDATETPLHLQPWLFSGAEADARRRDTLTRATFVVEPAEAEGLEREALEPVRAELSREVPECHFVASPPTGTSDKFDCMFPGGAIAKVKYGRNAEIHSEAAATRLLRRLGYPADFVSVVPRLRCYGCPRLPFLAMHLQARLGFPVLADDEDHTGYTDFEWVSVERKFPAPSVETETQEGWSWWELEQSHAPRAEVDALRLTAMLLAHWDNKGRNQRLVCLDEAPQASNAECRRPLAMIQDLGAAFGPSKLNLARWRDIPIWHDRGACVVSMRRFPFSGASFPDAVISEAGRVQLAGRLATITDAEAAQLFTDARFPQFQKGTADERELQAWVAAFRSRVRQIVDARCEQFPTANSQLPNS